MKLKIKVEKFSKAIAVQILEMDERFRSGGGFAGSGLIQFKSKNNFEIKSLHRPQIELIGKTTEGKKLYGIYLRGPNFDKNRDSDLDVFCIKFGSNEERDIFERELHIALDDWAENWHGWKDRPKHLQKSNLWEF